jgi:hypothetical protein
MTKSHIVPLAGLGLVLGLALILVPAAGQSGASQKMPGPLSTSHASKPGEGECSACHVAPGKISPAKCLACHTEIASRIAAHKGFHRDKPDDCGVCHAEHQGRQAQLLPLDPSNFDHSETGADLAGAHLRPRTCDACHTPANSYPRSHGRSYLLKVPGCRGCHTPPHPGRQEQCLACHDQESWAVGRPPEED